MMMISVSIHVATSGFYFIIFLWREIYISRGFPGVSTVKNLPSSAENAGLVAELGRSSGEGYGNPLQYSYLENPMDRGAWWATVCGVTRESDMT